MKVAAMTLPTEPDTTDVSAVSDSRVSQGLSRVERVLCGLLGAALTITGTVAVFETDNEFGSVGLLVVGGTLLLMALGYAPTRLKVGDREVELERVAAGTLVRAFREGDTDTRETIREAFDEELADRGISVDQVEAVRAMIRRFENFTGSTAPSEVHATLLSRGWQPSTPPKSTYVRWVYSGSKRTVSIYQNSTYLVAAAVPLRELAKDFPGAEVRTPKNEVNFLYVSGPAAALDAADRIRSFADNG